MITISEVFKPNTLIFIVGILIILLYNLLNKFTLKKLIFIILFSTIPFIIAAIPPIYYQHRTGLNLLNPPPEIVHVEMGLSSTETIVEGIVTGDKVMSYGWYNGATNDSANSTVENDAEYIKTNNVIKIKQHINHFINNPKYTLDFFGKKYISQWGSNDFSVFGQYFGNKTSVMSSFARSVVEGSGYKLLQIYMQAYKLIIAVFTLVALIILSKSKKIIVFLIPFIIAGAAAFYQISEGKDEYVMPFFVLMLPYAAYGLNRFFIKVEKRLNLKTYN
ncbi:MAG: hypothetical protein LBN03_01145 [Bifidobacteriaceae bacterium]|nr:hypothetical protein [Bifidobacteriaceae bacterium]